MCVCICSLISFCFRYQFFLQVKQDILQGRLPVSFELAAELGAYIVQCKLLLVSSTGCLPIITSALNNVDLVQEYRY